MRHALSGMTVEEMEAQLPLSPSFRALQIFEWIARGASSFDEMRNIPKPLREELKTIAAVRTTSVSKCITDSDGTQKLQLRLRDGAAVESVIMTDARGRKTVCVSSQAGCACACAFCMTGTRGLSRNLEASEIVEQFLIAEGTRGCRMDNMVLMGMGEPMLNLAAVRKALAVLSDKRGRGLSMRRVTLSTCGIISGIDDLADKGPYVRLAVSLTTADEALRRKLMPIAQDNPLGELRDAIARYAKASGRRVTLEAVLLGGTNTGEDSARHLIDFARGMDVNINLIPWNEVACLPFKAPEANETKAFVKQLRDASLNVTVRAHHGRGVAGACGQLGETAAGGGMAAIRDSDDI